MLHTLPQSLWARNSDSVSSPATQRSSTPCTRRGNISKPITMCGRCACNAASVCSCQRWWSMSSCCSPRSTTARCAIAASNPLASTGWGTAPSARAQDPGSRHVWAPDCAAAAIGASPARLHISASAPKREREDMTNHPTKGTSGRTCARRRVPGATAQPAAQGRKWSTRSVMSPSSPNASRRAASASSLTV